MNKFIEASISYLVYAVGKPYVWYKRHKNPSPGDMRKQRILVVRMDALGDMVVTSPFLRELRAAYPEAEITLVCSQYVVNLVERCPYVNHVISCPMARHVKPLFLHQLKDCLTFAITHFRGRCYDLAFSPIGSPNYINAWLNYLSGAARRIGKAEGRSAKHAHARCMGAYDVFFTDHVHANARHEVENVLAMLHYMHLPVRHMQLEVWPDRDDRVKVERLFAEAGVNADRMKVVVCLTTSDPSRNWPVENYVAVCRRLRQKQDVELLVVGAGEAAVQAAKAFCSALPEAHDFTNRTTLRETAALMQLSDFHLGGDTGTAHIAAACGLRGVELFKSVRWEGHPKEDPSQWFAPWQSPIQIIRPSHAMPGCEHTCISRDAHCIKLIAVDEVVKAMECAMQSV